MKLIYNYHTHSKRCGHAIGEDEDYLRKALELGIKRFGFSDHMIFPDGYKEPGIRGNPCEFDDYIESTYKLREKYKDQAEILIGFEAEYIPQMVDYYKSLLKDKIDYLILGQHCYLKDKTFINYFHKDSDINDVRKYIDDVIDGVKSGLFKYLCHPDLFMHSQYEWNIDLENESKRLLKVCEEYHMPIEINICGMRRKGYDEIHYCYPNINFYKLAAKFNIKFVLGVDAHDPNHFNQIDVDKAIDFANRCGIKIDFEYKIFGN